MNAPQRVAPANCDSLGDSAAPRVRFAYAGYKGRCVFETDGAEAIPVAGGRKSSTFANVNKKAPQTRGF
jgi:hypothetical protein